MTDTPTGCAGGCLCGAVRYQAQGAPLYAGYCYCGDCRKASGSAFVPFMGFRSSAIRISGETLVYVSRSIRGGDAVRNSCPICGSLVFGGRVGLDTEHTVYAGSLDDPSNFKPRIAIFTRDLPAWAIIPQNLEIFETLPG